MSDAEGWTHPQRLDGTQGGVLHPQRAVMLNAAAEALLNPHLTDGETEAQGGTAQPPRCKRRPAQATLTQQRCTGRQTVKGVQSDVRVPRCQPRCAF